MAGGINEVNTFRGTTVATTRADNLRAQFNSAQQSVADQLYGQADSYVGVHDSWLSFLAAFAQATLVRQANDSSPLPTGTVEEALDALIDQMTGADTIKANTVSVSVSADSGNTGDGVVAASVVASDGGKLENVFAEAMKVEVSGDSFSDGATEGSEPATVKGVVGPTDPLAWNFALAGYGSNAEKEITFVDASLDAQSGGNLLTNSDFEEWGDVNANLPNNWELEDGTPGTDILKVADPYTGSFALKMLSDSSSTPSIKQQFGSANGTTSELLPRQVIAVCLWTKVGASAPAAGVLKVRLIDGTDAVVRNDKEIADSVSPGVANVLTIDLTAESTTYAPHWAFFQLPSVLPSTPMYLEVTITTAITASKYVIADRLACAVAGQMYNDSITDNIAGGPYLVGFSGADAFVRGDKFTVTVANDYGGKFQQFLWKVFDTPTLGVRVPSATGGAQTISEALVT